MPYGSCLRRIRVDAIQYAFDLVFRYILICALEQVADAMVDASFQRQRRIRNPTPKAAALIEAALAKMPKSV